MSARRAEELVGPSGQRMDLRVVLAAAIGDAGDAIADYRVVPANSAMTTAPWLTEWTLKRIAVASERSDGRRPWQCRRRSVGQHHT